MPEANTELLGLAKKAQEQKQYKFRDLYVLINEELLLDSWRLIRKDAAYGVDRISAQDYEQNLEENIRDLVDRLKRDRYHAKLVRRHYIPKPDGRLRPLGIPTVSAYCTSYNTVLESPGLSLQILEERRTHSSSSLSLSALIVIQ